MKKGRVTVQEHETRYAPRLFRAGKQIACDVARDSHLAQLTLFITLVLRGLDNSSVTFVFLGLEFNKLPTNIRGSNRFRLPVDCV